MFSVHTTPKEFKNATITGCFIFLFEEISAREITLFSWSYRVRKGPFWNVFRPRENSKPAFLNSSDLKSVFEKLRFRDGLLWTVGLHVEIKLFLNSSGVVWTESGVSHDVNKHHQTKGFMTKTKALQVSSVNLCTFHSRPLQMNNAKWRRMRTMSRTANFSYFHLELNAVITYLTSARF